MFHNSPFPYIGWHPTNAVNIDLLIEFAGLTPSDCFYDLGCGDGRVLVAAAQKSGCKCVGVEVSTELCSKARKATEDADLCDTIEIRHEDAFKVDLTRCTVAYMYLHPEINLSIVKRFERLEIDDNTARRIIVHLWSQDMIKFIELIAHLPSRLVSAGSACGNEWFAEYHIPFKENIAQQQASLKLNNVDTTCLSSLQPPALRDLIRSVTCLQGLQDNLKYHNRHSSCYSN